MRTTDVFEILVDAAISPHVTGQFSCKIIQAVLGFQPFTTLSGWPGLETIVLQTNILFCNHYASKRYRVIKTFEFVSQLV